MRSYLALFKLKFITNLQYRSAALAGLSTQFFFGFVFIMVYLAFYESNASSVPMPLDQLVSYLWLQQSFFALIYLFYKDKEIISMIRKGDIAYELCRPQNIYFKWYAKIYASRLADVLMRFLPIILIALILPKPFNLSLPYSLESFILFITTLLLSSFLVAAVITIYHILTFYTLEADGVIGMVITISDIFSGSVVPLVFFPSFLAKIANILPFKYIADLPFRVYTGNILPSQCYSLIYNELIWIAVIVIIGYLLTNRALKKVVVQGG